MPRWSLCICIPRFVRPKSQEEEQEFFQSAAPVNATDSYEALYHAFFGAYAACRERDFSLFCKSIDAMQRTAWKSAEWREYGDPLYKLEAALRSCGANCVGMSSLGPLLYCFGSEDSLEHILGREQELNCDIVRTVPLNAGRKVLVNR